MFETNIDKALGAFITGALAMAVALKFGYPIAATWLVGQQPRQQVAHAAQYSR
jgi:hypothetical protein